ncbi:hypothetical protein DSECCO2_586540 [anaerobic digester metagenome]
MVKTPVAYTFAAATPLIEPNKPLEMTAIFAGPPMDLPARETARLVKYSPVFVFCMNAPKMTKTATSVAVTPMMEP